MNLSGLSSLVAIDAPAVRHGLAEENGRWRFAADPETYRLSPKSLANYLANVTCPVVMASGEHDAMAPPSSLAHLGRPVVTLDGLGHNAHVEDPRAVLGLLERLD